MKITLCSLFLIIVMGSGLLCAVPPGNGDRPNILFILADDLGWGDLSAYGNERLKTPHLDRLAAQGQLFTQFYVNGSVCSPSRCAFFTGQYPARHRIHGHYATPEQNRERGMSQWLDPKVPNIASLLKSAGYRTAHIGKWHLSPGRGTPESPDPMQPSVADYGFDFVGTGERGGAVVQKDDPYFRARSTAIFVDEALKFIVEDKARPFYIQLWTLVPHATLNPTEAQLAPFSSDNGPEDIHIANASHSGVGSAGPFRGRKRSLYEGGIRVPFIVRWPGKIPVGRVEDSSVVAGVDFLPTVRAGAACCRPQQLPLAWRNP